MVRRTEAICLNSHADHRPKLQTVSCHSHISKTSEQVYRFISCPLPFDSRIGKKIQKSEKNAEINLFIFLTVSLPTFKSFPFNLSMQFCSLHWGNGILDRCGTISWFSEALLSYSWSFLIKGTGT